jgi:flagella basal body P-ring formation protein FlgA
MLRALVFLVVGILLNPALAGQIVRIADRVEVKSERIVLKDIAQIEPALPELTKIPLGYAPYPGHHRWMTKSDVEHYLHKWGVREGVEIRMSEKVLITRQSQPVEAEKIVRKVEQFLVSAHPGMKISIRGVTLPDAFFLPRGRVDIRVDAPSSVRRLKGLNLKLDFYVDSQRYKSQWVKINAVAEGPVLVLQRDIPFGQPLKNSDLAKQVRQFEKIEDFVLSPEGAVGRISKRPLSRGEILRRTDLRLPTLVKRGEVVTLMARGGSFVVSTLARARDSGSRGDTILVENLDSKEIVNARITASRTVEALVPGDLR